MPMHKGKKPLISVLMGVYYRRNDLSMLQRAVDSILNQTYGNFELLICDDGSTTEAASCLEGYAETDSRVQLIRGVKDTSLPAKLNECLGRATGVYIARMDDDDFSHPERFETQIAFLETNPEISFVGSNVFLMGDSGVFGQKSFPVYPTVRDFYMTQPFVHPTLVFRREALTLIGGYSEDARCDHCEDYDLLLRLYAKGYRGANLQTVLFDYTAPNARGNRTMKHRWNECVTRYHRFRELGVLWQAIPYVVKPVLVGFVPSNILSKWKKRTYDAN